MAGRGLFVTALALLTLGAPRVLQAQAAPASAAPAAAPQAVDPKLEAFAKLHAELNATRDEFFAKLGRIHDDVGKQEVRDELNKRIGEILTQHGTTQQEYQRMIFLISSDAAQRETFEALLREIATS